MERKQANRTYLTPEQLKENGKASKRAYYCNNRHEFLQPGGRYYDYLHRKATCEKCGAVRLAHNLKKHQQSNRCVSLAPEAHIKNSSAS